MEESNTPHREDLNYGGIHPYQAIPSSCSSPTWHLCTNPSEMSPAIPIPLGKHSELHPWRSPIPEIKKKNSWDFPNNAVVKTPCFQCRGCEFNLWSRNQDPTYYMLRTKKKERRKKKIFVYQVFPDSPSIFLHLCQKNLTQLIISSLKCFLLLTPRTHTLFWISFYISPSQSLSLVPPLLVSLLSAFECPKLTP